ncbi:MAG: YdcF family protein [Pseudomonadota bacterium]
MRRLIAFAILVFGAALGGTAFYIYSYTDPDPLPRADAIVVLSGPLGVTPPLVGETLDRTERGIDLFNAGLAPRLVMTGGTEDAGVAPVAERMADHAISRGVPAEAILVENASHSTLQNARFIMDLDAMAPDTRLILVTHRYHLPRSWASFRWAGFRSVSLVAADEGPVGISVDLLMEGIKWPANILRAAGASIADAAGLDRADVDPWLQ